MFESQVCRHYVKLCCKNLVCNNTHYISLIMMKLPIHYVVQLGIVAESPKAVLFHLLHLLPGSARPVTDFETADSGISNARR